MSRPRVALCATVTAYKCDGRSEREWLEQVDRWRRAQTFDLDVFCAMQIGQGHDEKLIPLKNLLDAKGATVWTFSIDDGLAKVSSGSRLKAICAGRNLCHEYVNERQGITHLLFLDTDTWAPEDLVDKLLEVPHPIVGADVPTYGLTGPPARIWEIDRHTPRCAWRQQVHDLMPEPDLSLCNCGRPVLRGADIQEHDLQTAGCLLLTRDAVNSIRWGWALDRGQTDDPWTESLAEKVGLGKVWVRHDVHCRHYPESIGPLEQRWHDLRVRR